MGSNYKSKELLYKEISKLLYDLFVTNIHAIAFQRDDGKYITKYLPVSEYLIEEMLKQHGSIGCYQQCYKSNMLKWICFDFDCTDKEKPDLDKLYMHNVKPLIEICDKYKINYLTEFSGRRGIHVWIIFSHLIPKDKAFQIVTFLKKELYEQIGELKHANLDLFPATDLYKGNIVGKQVKLPLSFHKSGAQSWLFQGDFDIEYYNNEDVFLNNQFIVLNEYKTNEYSDVVKKIGIDEDDFITKFKYKKYSVYKELNLSVSDVVETLSETTVYAQLFKRLYQGKTTKLDWLVILGTFSPLNDGGKFIRELFSTFAYYDVKKTEINIARYKDKYYPATFEYLYSLYGLQKEPCIDVESTGFSYLLHKKGIEYFENGTSLPEYIYENDVMLKDVLNKEIKYIQYNDEVLNVAIWNSLNTFKYSDLDCIDKYVAYVIDNNEKKILFEPQFVTYERYENENKTRILVSLSARDRVLTTYASLLLHNRMKKMWNSFSYNVSVFSKEDIFYNWYSSWAEYLNRIKTFTEIPFMNNYEVFTIDIEKFYDNIDFLSVYRLFEKEMDNVQRNLFKFLIDYNDKLMRKFSGESRIGVPQGPAYARIISEMYLDSVLSIIVSIYDESAYKMYRYVDDIIFFVKPNNDSNKIFNYIKNKLISFGLPINEEKSKWYGPIKSLTKDEKDKITRKDKFTYDLQYMDYKGFVTLEERNLDTEKYLKSSKFDIGDLGLFFNYRTYTEASDGYFYKYAKNIMENRFGRGILFRRFYRYLLVSSDKLNFALEQGYFDNIPLNSVNFGNLIGELYYLIQKKEIGHSDFEYIKIKYLKTINCKELSDEYRVIVDALIKIKLEVENA